MNDATEYTGTVKQVLFANNFSPLEANEFLRLRVEKLQAENEILEKQLHSERWKTSQFCAILAQYIVSTGAPMPMKDDVMSNEEFIAVVRAYQAEKLTISIYNDSLGLSFYIPADRNPYGEREPIPCEKTAFFERLRELYGIVPMPIHAPQTGI